MNWEDLFEPHILDRGYSYYRDGKVYYLDVGEERIHGEVTGSEDYEVDIYPEDGEFVDMYCTCPYAQGGDNCKHMAAVLYEWEKCVERQNVGCRAEDLVAEAPDRLVREFLVEVLQKDKKLAARFKEAVKEDNVGDLPGLKGMARNIVEEYMEDDYIDEVGDCADALRDFFFKYGDKLLEKDRPKEALELILYCLKLWGEECIEDEEGATRDIVWGAVEVLSRMISTGDIQFKREVYNRLWTEYRKSESEAERDCIDELLFTAFEEREFLEKNLEIARGWFREARKNKNDIEQDFIADISLNKCVDMMQRLGASHEEIIDLCRKNLDLNSAGKICIKEYYATENYAEAVALINILRERMPEWRHKEYDRKLRELYKLMNMRDEYIEVLHRLAKIDIDYYRELKGEYTPEQWQIEREEIIREAKSEDYMTELFLEEEMYDRLLSCVIKSYELYMAERYHDVLVERYPDEMLEKYRSELEKKALGVANRNQYAWWVSVLRKMKEIKGGNRVVEEMVARWRVTYRQRRAMMEELNKL